MILSDLIKCIPTISKERFEDHLQSYLLNPDHTIDDCDMNGNCLLISATQSNRLDIIKVLLQYNPDIDCNNHCTEVPLVVACFSDFEDIAQYLLEKGADINSVNWYGQTPLMGAVEKNNAHLINLLIRKADLSKKDVSQKSALSIALNYGYINVIETLIVHNSDIVTGFSSVTGIQKDRDYLEERNACLWSALKKMGRLIKEPSVSFLQDQITAHNTSLKEETCQSAQGLAQHTPLDCDSARIVKSYLSMDLALTPLFEGTFVSTRVAINFPKASLPLLITDKAKKTPRKKTKFKG